MALFEGESEFPDLSNKQKHYLSLELEKEKFKSDYQRKRVLQRQREISKKLQDAKELSTLAMQKNEEILNADDTSTETDFFGRPIKRTSKIPQKYTKHSEHAFFFKFQEGYTNAVRRTVYVKDFL